MEYISVLETEALSGLGVQISPMVPNNTDEEVESIKQAFANK